jgi:hypothetical protein
MLLCIIFIISRVGAISSHNNCVHYNKVSITGFKLNIVTGATPLRIGFIEYVKDLVSKLNIWLLIQLLMYKFKPVYHFAHIVLKLGECICNCVI